MIQKTAVKYGEVTIAPQEARIAALEAENSRLRHELANARQVSLFAQELMGMGEVDV